MLNSAIYPFFLTVGGLSVHIYNYLLFISILGAQCDKNAVDVDKSSLIYKADKHDNWTESITGMSQGMRKLAFCNKRNIKVFTAQLISHLFSQTVQSLLSSPIRNFKSQGSMLGSRKFYQRGSRFIPGWVHKVLPFPNPYSGKSRGPDLLPPSWNLYTPLNRAC